MKDLLLAHSFLEGSARDTILASYLPQSFSLKRCLISHKDTARQIGVEVAEQSCPRPYTNYTP